MKRSETVVTLICDGCQRVMDPDALLGVNAPGLWRSVRVQLAKPSGETLVDKTADLCGECVDRVVVPGVREAVAA